VDSNKGQTLDRIEDNVGDAQEYVEKGKQQLAKAEEHKKSSNKVWAFSDLSDQGSTHKSRSVMLSRRARANNNHKFLDRATMHESPYPTLL